MKRTIQSTAKKDANGKNIVPAQPTNDDALSNPAPDAGHINSSLHGISADLVIETALAQLTKISPDLPKLLGNVDDTCQALRLQSPSRSFINIRHTQLNDIYRRTQLGLADEKSPEQPAAPYINSNHSKKV